MAFDRGGNHCFADIFRCNDLSLPTLIKEYADSVHQSEATSAHVLCDQLIAVVQTSCIFVWCQKTSQNNSTMFFECANLSQTTKSHKTWSTQLKNTTDLSSTANELDLRSPPPETLAKCPCAVTACVSSPEGLGSLIQARRTQLHHFTHSCTVDQSNNTKRVSRSTGRSHWSHVSLLLCSFFAAAVVSCLFLAAVRSFFLFVAVVAVVFVVEIVVVVLRVCRVPLLQNAHWHVTVWVKTPRPPPVVYCVWPLAIMSSLRFTLSVWWRFTTFRIIFWRTLIPYVQLFVLVLPHVCDTWGLVGCHHDLACHEIRFNSLLMRSLLNGILQLMLNNGLWMVGSNAHIQVSNHSEYQCACTSEVLKEYESVQIMLNQYSAYPSCVSSSLPHNSNLARTE